MNCLAFSFVGLLWAIVFLVFMMGVGCIQLVEKVSESEEVKNAAKDGLVNLFMRWLK